MSEEKETQGPSRWRRTKTSLWIAAPFVVLKLTFLANISGWENGLAVGALQPVLIGFLLCLIIFAAIEFRLRSAFTRRFFRFPWYALCLGIAMTTFFAVGACMEPIVALNPAWSRVGQELVWRTSISEQPDCRPHGDKAGNDWAPENSALHLEFSGPGNIAAHEWVSGRMYWTGNEELRVSKIEFRPLSFRCNGESIFSKSSLAQCLTSSELSTDETERLASEVWDVLHQANSNLEISAANAHIGQIWTLPRGYADKYLGGGVWILALVAACLLVGFRTLPPK